jgi:hypothetical protein
MADSFVLLMESMAERYRAINDVSIQCQFLMLQLVIVDEFRARIVQIAAQCESIWQPPFPALLNALWSISIFFEFIIYIIK